MHVCSIYDVPTRVVCLCSSFYRMQNSVLSAWAVLRLTTERVANKRRIIRTIDIRLGIYIIRDIGIQILYER